MQWRAILHFYNGHFAFFAVVFYNLTFFSIVSKGFIPYHVAVLSICLFVAFSLWRLRAAILADVEHVIAASIEEEEEEGREARRLVQSSLSVGDIAEWTRGSLLRFLSEIALFLFLFLKIVGRLCAVRLGVEFLILAPPPSDPPLPPLASFAVFLLLLILLSMLPSYLWIGGVSIFGSLAGFAGVVFLSSNIMAAEEISENSTERYAYLSAFSLSSGQIGAIFLPITNAAADFPQALLSGAVSGSVLAAACVSVLGVTLLRSDVHAPLPMLFKMGGPLPQQLVALLTEAAIFPLLVLPCVQLLERRLLTAWKRNSSYMDLLDFDRVHPVMPLFERLRRRDRHLRPRDIVQALSHKPPWIFRTALRSLLLATAWGISIGCWYSENLVNTLHFLQVAGVMFIAYTIPIFQFLVTQWSKIPMWMRILCFGVIIFTLLLTVPFYCALIRQFVK